DGATGDLLARVTLPRDIFGHIAPLGICGMTFGPDGLLYAHQPQFPSPNVPGDSITRYDPQTLAFLGVFVNQDSRILSNETQKPRFGPDGNLYVPTSLGTVVRYDGTTGSFIDTFLPNVGASTTDLGFAPDGSLYVSGGAGLHYDGTTGSFLGQLPPPSGGWG